MSGPLSEQNVILGGFGHFSANWDRFYNRGASLWSGNPLLSHKTFT